MKNEQIIVENPQNHYCRIKCVSWSAIIIGAFVGIGISFLLNLFGLAIGLTAFTKTSTGLISLALGGFLGLLIIAVVSMFTAGWVAGYLGRANCYNRNLGAIYGFTTWCLALLMTVIFASQVTHFISFQYRSLSNPQLTVANITHQNPQHRIKKQTTVNSDANDQTASVAVNEEKTTGLGLTLFVTFLLFFVGALASCLGGYCGLKPQNNRDV